MVYDYRWELDGLWFIAEGYYGNFKMLLPLAHLAIFVSR